MGTINPPAAVPVTGGPGAGRWRRRMDGAVFVAAI
jgi:hypothetical protein